MVHESCKIVNSKLGSQILPKLEEELSISETYEIRVMINRGMVTGFSIYKILGKGGMQ